MQVGLIPSLNPSFTHRNNNLDQQLQFYISQCSPQANILMICSLQFLVLLPHAEELKYFFSQT